MSVGNISTRELAYPPICEQRQPSFHFYGNGVSPCCGKQLWHPYEDEDDRMCSWCGASECTGFMPLGIVGSEEHQIRVAARAIHRAARLCPPGSPRCRAAEESSGCWAAARPAGEA